MPASKPWILCGAALIAGGVWIYSDCRTQLQTFTVRENGWRVSAYRVMTGPISRRFELRAEYGNESVLLHQMNGDWYRSATFTGNGDRSCQADSFARLPRTRADRLEHQADRRPYEEAICQLA